MKKFTVLQNMQKHISSITTNDMYMEREIS